MYNIYNSVVQLKSHIKARAESIDSPSILPGTETFARTPGVFAAPGGCELGWWRSCCYCRGCGCGCGEGSCPSGQQCCESEATPSPPEPAGQGPRPPPSPLQSDLSLSPASRRPDRSRWGMLIGLVGLPISLVLEPLSPHCRHHHHYCCCCFGRYRSRS